MHGLRTGNGFIGEATIKAKCGTGNDENAGTGNDEIRGFFPFGKLRVRMTTILDDEDISGY